MKKKLSLIIFLIVCCPLLIQCSNGRDITRQRVEHLLHQSEKALMSYHDNDAWSKAVTAERISRKKEYKDYLSKALIIKGLVCSYADLSETDNRNKEALIYLNEAAYVADAGEVTRERISSRYAISEVYVNMNRWKGDSLDTGIYAEAGKWLEEGEVIAAENGIDDLAMNGRRYRLRYLRQGSRYEEAISLCHEIIDACGEEDYLTLQQMYDQLTALYTQVGDNEASLEAHSKYAKYMQSQMSETAEDGTAGKGVRVRKWVLILIAMAVIVLGMGALLARKKLHELISESNAKKVRQTERTRKVSIDELTARELEIIRLTSENKTTAEIAATLCISQRTVSNHKQNIYSKLGVNSSSEMLRLFENYDWSKSSR